MENSFEIYSPLPAGNWMKLFPVKQFLEGLGLHHIELKVNEIPRFQCTNGTFLLRFEDLERCISKEIFEKMQFHVTQITIAEDPVKNKKAFIRIG